MTARHTTGLLTISGPSRPTPDNPEGGDYAIKDATGAVIAECFARVAEGPSGTRPARENAQLFAAATELLEALQAAEQALNKIRVCCHHTAWDATGPAVIAARAAIAKATWGVA